jgi:hypothetical protein
MPVGQVGSGVAAGFAQYVQQERERQRKVEDDSLDMHMKMIQSLADRPDANPAMLGKAIHDILEFSNAKGNAKLKGGTAGLLGAHELPVSQFLQGIQDGTTPIVGRTTEAHPAAQQGMAGMIGPQPITNMEIPGITPPPSPTMPDAVSGNGTDDNWANHSVMRRNQQMQDTLSRSQQEGVLKQAPSIDYKMGPATHQPLFRSPDEMAEEKARAGVASKDTEVAGNVARIRQYISNPDDREEAINTALGVPTGFSAHPRNCTRTPSLARTSGCHPQARRHYEHGYRRAGTRGYPHSEPLQPAAFSS